MGFHRLKDLFNYLITKLLAVGRIEVMQYDHFWEKADELLKRVFLFLKMKNIFIL